MTCPATGGMVAGHGHEPSLVSWEGTIRNISDGRLLAAETLWPREPECLDPDEQYLPEQELKAFLEMALAGGGASS